MSAKKKKGVAVASSGIVVGNGKRRTSFRARLAGLTVVGLLIIAGLGFGALALWHHLNPPKKQATPEQTAIESHLTPTQKAEYETVVTGDYSGALDIYKSQLQSAKTNTDKAAIYSSMASVSQTAKDYKQAYSYGEQAEKLDPTVATAKYLGYIAQLQGNKSLATKEYNVAISRVDKNLPNADRIISQIQVYLNEVK